MSDSSKPLSSPGVPNVAAELARPAPSGRIRTVSFAVFLFVIGAAVLLAFVLFFRPEVRTDLLGQSSVSTPKVYISLPLHRSSAQTIVNSVQLALEQVNYAAGGLHVAFVPLDDGDANGILDPDKERANAESAAADPNAVVYISGDGGGTDTAMPIINTAGIAEVGIADTWPGLTKAGFIPGQPALFYPTGLRHYVRLNVTSDVEADAAAAWAKELGFASVFIVDDGSEEGAGMAELFDAGAEARSISVLGHASLDPQGDQSALAKTIHDANPALVYYGGATAGGAGLLQALRAANVAARFMGGSGIAEKDFITEGGALAEGALVTVSGALASSVGTAEAGQYHHDYDQKYGTDPDPIGGLAYDMAQMIIASIAEAPVKSRAGILATIKNTTDYKGIFGTWSFTTYGDTTQSLVSALEVTNGSFRFVKNISGGH